MRTLLPVLSKLRLAACLLLAGACLWSAQQVRAQPVVAQTAAVAASAAQATEAPASAAAGPVADPMETVRERLQDKLRSPSGEGRDTPTAQGVAADDPESAAMARLRERLSKRLGLDAQVSHGNELRLTTRAASPAEVEAARLAAHSPAVAAVRARANPGVAAPVALAGGRSRAAGAQGGSTVAAVGAGAVSAGAASAPAAALSASAPAPTPVPGLPWAYSGPNGPQAWGRLKPEYAACARGKRQSPIDIRDGIPVNLEPLVVAYRPSSLRVVDDGRILTAHVGAGNSVQLRGRRYELQTVQLHTPAEERVQGKVYDMSADLLHKDPQGQWLVVTVLLERGPAQSLLQTLLDNLPLEKGDDVNASQPVDWSGLLPADPRYHIYMGSLSAPPCTEGVVRVVMKTPMTVSPEQHAIFSRLYPMNARPPQAMAGRMVKESN